MEKRKYLKLFVSLVISGFLLIFIFCLLIYYINSSPNIVKLRTSYFSIDRGENFASIAGRLESSGYIRSSLFMKVLSKITKTDTGFMAGFYKIKSGATTIDIHNSIVRGNQSYIRVTIPEGWTKSKIASYFEELGIAGKNEFLEATKSPELLAKFGVTSDSLEGYLYPDTYYFSENFPPEKIVEKFVETFFKNLKLIVPDCDTMDRKTLHDKIILASIIEREYRVKEEAPVIASVFYNRLKSRVGLESCATLEYIITEVLGLAHPHHITLDMKNIDSKYNTYKWHGLPPGPISNPGIVALKASFFPAKTDLWFFVVKNPTTGEHYFSKNLEEHIDAKYFYLKGVGVPPKAQ
jgi:UPF0755 protein